jgi:hypothetical protein
VAVVEREVGHVQNAIQAETGGTLAEDAPIPRDHLGDELQRKLVMPCGYRRVRRKCTHRLDLVHDVIAEAVALAMGELIGELDDQQARVTFVHVKAPDRVVAECAQHTHAANAEHDLLRQTVALVAAVKHVG